MWIDFYLCSAMQGFVLLEIINVEEAIIIVLCS